VTSTATRDATLSSFRAELRKLGAMLRRDFLIALSYRTAFVSDLVSLSAQVVLFALLGRLIDPATLPSYGDSQAGYLGFVAIGIAVTAFVAVGLSRMTAAVRTEQLTGTLEMLLLTPTRLMTLQLGWIVYDLLYVPLRTLGFLGVVVVLFGVDFAVSGLLPSLVLLLAFVPFVWGLGVAGAGVVLTFRRGSGLFGYVTMGLAFASGAYVPLDVLPGWVTTVAALNPVALTVEGIREALIGGAGWQVVTSRLVVLAVASAISFVLGTAIFRRALRRELRVGTLGQY
jgi:ABC-2 type transport system permease protein